MSDLIIIGAGPGGYETALAAAGAGLKVTLINGGRLGGTCLNEGCIPTKCMVRDASVVSTLREAGGICVASPEYAVDFDKIRARKENVVATLRDGVAGLLKRAKVELVEGKARFKDSSTVTVDGMDYEADRIIIATGSRSKSLPVPGADDPRVLDSTKLLDIDHVPERLVIVGGGVIGMEFATIFNALGSEVTVVEYMKQILPPFDSDIAKRLKQTLSKRGINIITGAAVTGIDMHDDGTTTVRYMLKEAEQQVECTDVLMAVGRMPNVEDLGLENAGVEWSKRGIPVNDNMQTNVGTIYAIGDVNARMMLAHVASAQGKRALNHILGRQDAIRMDVVPSAVFTDPECGMVGLTEDQCKEQGIAVTVGKSFYRGNGKALAMGEPDGLVKLIFDRESELLLGAHVMGAEAALIAQQCADMIAWGKTRSEIRDLIFGHPTLSEVILAACE